MRFTHTRLALTHEQRGICVISGPWGIGKTTAAHAFAKEHSDECVILKVEQGAMVRGASPVFVLQQLIQVLRPFFGFRSSGAVGNAFWPLRQMLNRYLHEWQMRKITPESGKPQPWLSIIFDEAQYLSREAIEMLRFWNDPDQTVTPFPVGLIFIGNTEFALREDSNGQSVLSGAVRSRAMFIEELDYADVTDADVEMFLLTRGPYHRQALKMMVRHYRQARIRRDFRAMARLDNVIRRGTIGQPIGCEDVRLGIA